VATPVASRKARNVGRNENVTLLIDDSGIGGVWPKGVIVYGKAKLDVTDLKKEELAHLCEKYFPKEKAERYAKAAKPFEVGENNNQTQAHGIIRLYKGRGIQDCARTRAR